MLQVAPLTKQSFTKVTDQTNRVMNALLQEPKDAETICVQAEEGDEAPAEGTFLVEGSSEVIVQQGYLTLVAGKYCIDNLTLALIQRANGFEDRASFERALSQKPADGTTQSKSPPPPPGNRCAPPSASEQEQINQCGMSCGLHQGSGNHQCVKDCVNRICR